MKDYKNKMVEEDKAVTKATVKLVFDFPKYNISFKANNIEEAYAKLDKWLKGRGNINKSKEIDNG